MNWSSLIFRLPIILIGSNSISNLHSNSNRIVSNRIRKYRLKLLIHFVLVDYAVPYSKYLNTLYNTVHRSLMSSQQMLEFKTLHETFNPLHLYLHYVVLQSLEIHQSLQIFLKEKHQTYVLYFLPSYYSHKYRNY